MRSAIRVALQEIVSGGVLKRVEDDPRVEVVHLLLPRMLLFRPRAGVVPRKLLEARIKLFQDGQRLQLLDESSKCAEKVHLNNVRRRRRRDNDGTRRGQPVLCLW